MEDWITQNWPLALAAAAGIFVVTGIIKKLVKLAVFAGLVAVVALVIWPAVSDKI